MEEKSPTKELSPEEVKQFLKDLRLGDANERAVAAYMLGTSGNKDKKIMQALTKALKDKSWEVRKWAALSLGDMGELSSDLVPILVEILCRDDSKEFKTHAAIILGDLKKRSVQAIPALSDATKDDNERIRDWACWALNEIAGKTTRYRSNYTEERPKLSDRLRFEPKKPEKD